MNSVMWLKDIKEYSKTYRVYAIDILGEPGKSDKNRFSLSGPYYAEWLKDVFENLSVERANVIIFSDNELKMLDMPIVLVLEIKKIGTKKVISFFSS